MVKLNKAINWTKLAASSLDLTGKKVTIVGGTDGLGRALAQLSANRGAEVTVVGRSFRDEGFKGLSFIKSDLSLITAANHLSKELLSPNDDVYVLSTGIIAAATREVTSEGIERDLAISYLSRLQILRNLVPRIKQKSPRIFIFGFPGAGNDLDLTDINCEKSYSVLRAHMNTVGGNEALVLYGAKNWKNIKFYGLNPGLIKTAIRANYTGTGWFSYFTESLIGAFNINSAQYAENIVPLLFAPEIETHSGAMFNQKGKAILPTPLMNDAHVEAIFRASVELVEKTVGNK